MRKMPTVGTACPVLSWRPRGKRTRCGRGLASRRVAKVEAARGIEAPWCVVAEEVRGDASKVLQQNARNAVRVRGSVVARPVPFVDNGRAASDNGSVAMSRERVSTTMAHRRGMERCKAQPRRLHRRSATQHSRARFARCAIRWQL